MRALIVVSLIALFCSAAAMAQSQPPSPAAAPGSAAAPATVNAAPKQGGDISRDQYVERAKQNAERRFDRMDADHNGVLTAEERRAWRDAHRRHRASVSH